MDILLLVPAIAANVLVPSSTVSVVCYMHVCIVHATSLWVWNSLFTTVPETSKLLVTEQTSPGSQEVTETQKSKYMMVVKGNL